MPLSGAGENLHVRSATSGYLTSRAAANIPQSATGGLFLVTGGRIMVIALVGEVTTAIQNQTCTLGYGTFPTTGSANNTNLGSTVTLTNAAVGRHFVSNTGGAVANDFADGAGVSMTATRLIVPAGSITATTSASNTGQMKFDLVWVPLDTGASVSAL